MTSDIKDNQEFAQWFGKWTARIKQRRTPVDKTANTEKEKRDPGTDTRAVTTKKGLPETYSRHD
jgi:hypothetical protein